MARLVKTRTQPNPPVEAGVEVGLSFAMFLGEQMALNKSLLGLSLINNKFD